MVRPVSPPHSIEASCEEETSITQRNKPCDTAVFGIDIGKNTFHVVGLDGIGAPIQRATFRRETLL